MRIEIDTDKLTVEEMDRLAPIVGRAFGRYSFLSPESAAVWFFDRKAGDQSEIRETPGELIRRGWRLAFAEMERGVDHLVKMRGREGFSKAAERAPEPLARLVAAIESHWAAEARYRLLRDIVIAYRGAIDDAQTACRHGRIPDAETVGLLSELTDILHRELTEGGDANGSCQRLRDALFSDADKEAIRNGGKYADALAFALDKIETCLKGDMFDGDDPPMFGLGEHPPNAYFGEDGKPSIDVMRRKITRTYARLVDARDAIRKTGISLDE